MSVNKKLKLGSLILMGGKNTRMGGIIKGLLNIGNETFLEHIISNLGNDNNLYLSLNNSFLNQDIRKYESMNFNVIIDEYKEIGPLGGIYSALKNCSEDYLFVTSCDMPFINEKLVELLSTYLDDEIDIVVCCDEKNRLYPLGAIYSRKTITIIESMIKRETYKLIDLIYQVNYIEIPLEKTHFSSEIFTNINTPEEYKHFLENYYKII